MAVLVPALFAGGDNFAILAAVAAVLALAEVAVLLAESRRYGIGVPRALAAMLGNVGITVFGFILVILVYFLIDPPVMS